MTKIYYFNTICIAFVFLHTLVQILHTLYEKVHTPNFFL